MVSGFRGVTARQCFQIATVYENAAADAMNVPRQQRAAFTRKARWFHMLARIKAAKEAAVVFKKKPLESDDTYTETTRAGEEGPLLVELQRL